MKIKIKYLVQTHFRADVNNAKLNEHIFYNGMKDLIRVELDRELKFRVIDGCSRINTALLLGLDTIAIDFTNFLDFVEGNDIKPDYEKLFKKVGIL